MISFKPFREIIEKRKITTYYLRNKCGDNNIDHTTIKRLMTDQSVSTNTINSLCNILDCKISDIMEFTLDEKNDESDKQEAVWTEYDKFKHDYDLSVENNKKFHEIVNDIMESKNLTVESLQRISKIDKRTIYRMKDGMIKTKTREMEYLPTLKTIIAFCIACELDMLNAITLLESLGLSFKRTSKLHYAYCYLIINCRGKSICECNNILRDFGIDKEDLLRDDV